MVSHKTTIIEMYFKGYEYTEIEQWTRHTGDSIKRYISGFSKVILHSLKDYLPIQIRELNRQSEKVVSEYFAFPCLDAFEKNTLVELLPYHGTRGEVWGNE
jgi:hypothetical protein